jgi:predicted nucleotidyltransferase
MAMLNAEEAIERVRSYFAWRDEFRLVIVYGSAAKGHFRADSDVDVAVAGQGALDRALLLSSESELSALLDRPVDLIDLGAVEGLILREVVTGGVRVKTDPELFVKFHTKVMTYREDFLPLKRAMQDARIERFIHGQRRSRDQA